MTALLVLARWVLGLILLTAGTLKGLDPHASVLSVGAYQLLPAALSLFMGVILPAIEVMAGAALLLGYLVPGASVVAGGLAMTFAAGVSSAMARHLDLECGCFGQLSITPRAGLGTLTFDTVLLFLAILSYFSVRRSSRLPAPTGT